MSIFIFLIAHLDGPFSLQEDIHIFKARDISFSISQMVSTDSKDIWNNFKMIGKVHYAHISNSE